MIFWTLGKQNMIDEQHSQPILTDQGSVHLRKGVNPLRREGPAHVNSTNQPK